MSAAATTGGRARPRPPARLRHSRLLLGDWTPLVRDGIDLLRLTYLVAALVFLVLGNFDAAVRMGLTFGLMLLARWISLPRPFDLGLVLGMQLQAWGNALNLFASWTWYDNVVHISLTAFAAPVFYIALARLETVPDLTEDTEKRHHLGIFIVTLALALAFGAVYEVYEWSADHWLGATLAISETDTVTDLLDDGIGGVLGAALLTVWAMYGWGTSRRVPPERLERKAAAGAQPSVRSAS